MRSTFPELDHYGAQTDVTYVGSIGLNSSKAAQQVAWPKSRGLPRLLAYVRSGLPCLGNLLDALRGFPAEVICVVPGLNPAVAGRYRSPRLQIFDRALRLRELLAEADLMVGYGGTATVAESLLAGVPLLLASFTVEQHMVAVRAGALGASVVMSLERSVGDCGRALTEATTNPQYKAAAGKFAERYTTFDEVKAIERVVSACEEIAGFSHVAAEDRQSVLVPLNNASNLRALHVSEQAATRVKSDQ
jgi:UDP:flavonoid glycosyltransferase YjiC (YdhE family)